MSHYVLLFHTFQLNGQFPVKKKIRIKHLPLDGLKERKSYWKLTEETLAGTVWRTSFENGYGPVVSQTNM
jgi:hypothetical protein